MDLNQTWIHPTTDSSRRFVLRSLGMMAVAAAIGGCGENTPPETEPTPTARPECPTEAEQAYLTALRQNIRVISGRMLVMLQLAEQIAEDPNVMDADDFKRTFANVVEVVHAESDAILARPRPASVRLGEIHDLGVVFARSVTAGIDDLARGIELLDGDAVDDGWEHIGASETHLNEVLDLIDAVCL